MVGDISGIRSLMFPIFIQVCNAVVVTAAPFSAITKHAVHVMRYLKIDSTLNKF